MLKSEGHNRCVLTARRINMGERFVEGSTSEAMSVGKSPMHDTRDEKPEPGSISQREPRITF